MNENAYNDTAPTPSEQDAGLVLDQVADHYRRGEQGYRDHLLAAGRRARDYVLLRIQQAKTKRVRAAAVQAIAGKLAEVAGTTVDVNRLIKVAMAVDLLAGDTDYSTLPYSTIRDAFALLVHRDRGQETWDVYPGVDPKAAKDLFRHVAVNKVTKDAALDLAKQLLDPSHEPKPKGRPQRDTDAQPEEENTHGTVAAYAVELIEGSQAPDDELQAILERLASGGALSGKAKRAVQAALLLLNRDSRSPSPAEVANAITPHRNGHMNGHHSLA